MNAKNQTIVVSSDASTRSTNAIRGYVFDQFNVDVLLQQLTRNGAVIPLTAKAFDLLLVLVANRERVLSKDELMNLVWPKTVVSENSLAQAISVLRRALEDDVDYPQYIATISRRGYRFVGDVAEVKHDGTLVGVVPGKTTDEPVVTTPIPAPAVAPVPVLVTAPTVPRSTATIAWSWVAAVALIASVAGAAAYVARSRPPVRAEPIRFTQNAPSGTRIISTSALSPDGRHLAFVAQDDQTHRTQLWIRALDTTEAGAVSGSEGASLPFWSPDSASIAFFSNSAIKRIDLSANLPQTIADTGNVVPVGGSWSTNGTILFSVWRSGIFSVPATGGKIEPVTVLDQAAHELGHRRPQFLPDGRHFLFDIDSTDPAHTGTYVASLDGAAKLRLAEQFATYASPGYLLLARDDVLVAERFDPARLRRLPGTNTIAEHVSSSTASASTNGLLAFQGSTLTTRLRWYSRAGQMLGAVEGAFELHNPVLSMDRRGLLGTGIGVRRGIWLIDLDRAAATELADGTSVVWSPDGSRIAFGAHRGGLSSEIYVRTISGNSEDLLLRTQTPATLMDWSPDGRFIVYVTPDPRTKRDLWLLPMSGEKKPVPYLQTPADEIQARISPDGRWVAYASDESGSWEVYVQSFPTPGSKRAISVGGGGQPKWRADGRELFYLSRDHHVMAVDVALGKTPELGRPKSLFQIPLLGIVIDTPNQYAPTADGQQFIVDTVDPMSPADAITVAVNWNAAATRR